MDSCFEDQCFQLGSGCELLDTPFREVTIPYVCGDLPAYLFTVDHSGTARPTIVYTNGIDSSREEGYGVIGAAALRNGFNFLAYDGPGQGSMIDQRGVPFRSDWEDVLGTVVDYASTVPEIDDDAIVQYGRGLGGYLVARYAAYDHRSAAIVCNDAMTTSYASYPPVPEPILYLIDDERDDEAEPLIEVWTKGDAEVRRALRNGQRAFGVDTAIEYIRRTADYSLTAVDVGRIQTPALVLEGEADTALAGQASIFARAMNAPVRHVVMHAEGATLELPRTVFDYLAETLR